MFINCCCQCCLLVVVVGLLAGCYLNFLGGGWMTSVLTKEQGTGNPNVLVYKVVVESVNGGRVGRWLFQKHNTNANTKTT